MKTLGADYFAVAYTREGISLREAGITTPILVLHPQPVNFKILLENCLEPSLYNARMLNAFLDFAKSGKTRRLSYTYKIQYRFKNRLGFWENDVDYIIKKLKERPSVKVKSIFFASGSQ